MSEIKIAQGAKQTGGKLLAQKVTDAIAYYRGVEPHQALYSPNRFPYANSIQELFDFVGIKIVISTLENFQAYSNEIDKRIQNAQPYPNFLTIDGGD